MFKFAAIVATLVLTVTLAFGAPPSTSPPLPPSATLFNGDYSFSTVGTTYSAPVSVPVDGAWLTGEGVWDNSAFPYWDCSHSYTGTLTPNGNDYAPLFIAGWQPDRLCTMQFPIFGCLTCGVAWGGQKAFPGNYMTTDNTPGFMAAGSGTIILKSNNGGGQSDRLTFFRVDQFNRDAMVNMTIYQSLDEENPAPASASEIADRYFIANSADRIPVVPVFHYGTESNGADRQFPAGPGIAWSVTWDNGVVTTVEEKVAPQGLHGHSILAVSLPTLTTGKHTFTVKGLLPSGKSYTSQAMEVFVYAQNIYVTISGNFAPKNPVDQAPQLVPGSAPGGASLDLVSAPQTVDLNILIGRGSSGTFDVKLTNVSRYPGIAMNYPTTGADTNPDMDFGGGVTEKLSVAIPKGGAPKVVTIPLYIRDYAASATVEVTMPYRKTTFTTRRSLPIDKNSNGLPDAGWSFVNRVSPLEYLPVADTNLSKASDDEVADPPGAPLPDPLTGAPKVQGISGDGLTAFEEFRGFFVEGQHTRTNPHRKDLFVRIDNQLLDYDNIFLSLPITFHYIYLATGEVQADSNGLHPLVNFNRDGTMTGASNQYALRLRVPPNEPTVIDGNGVSWPVSQFFLGRHFRVGANLNTINLNTVQSIATPNDTLVVEIYPRAFGNETITHAPGQSLASVPPCTDLTVRGCDEYDPVADEIKPGPDQVLDTVRVSPDLGVELLVKCAGGFQFFIDATHAPMRSATLAHEAAHGLLVDHVEFYMDAAAACGQSVMYSSGTTFPIPTQYLAVDKQQLRTHAKHP